MTKDTVPPPKSGPDRPPPTPIPGPGRLFYQEEELSEGERVGKIIGLVLLAIPVTGLYILFTSFVWKVVFLVWKGTIKQ